MRYQSTRGNYPPVTPSEAVKLGLAPDGGLFVPERHVGLTKEKLQEMLTMNYRQRALQIMQPFLADFSAEELNECVSAAYNGEKFDTPEIAPVRKLEENLYVLELWHGPTCAFKDMALQILPHLLVRAAAKAGEKAEIVILVATSGDTGKAALEGFKDVPGTRIIVFYPEEGVSEVQKLQMITQEGRNVYVAAVRGNFDDAQSGVKAIFADRTFNEELNRLGYVLSSANSINWGRLIPQVVYYVSAYLDLLQKGEIKPGEEINFVVPTGNFGNILAAFYARQMGLPVRKLICASNENNVLTEFIRTGVYNRNRPFKKTLSPSMDILISSNLERLLFELGNRDGEKVRNWMMELQHKGTYQVDDEMKRRVAEIFWADFADDRETLDSIGRTFRSCGYILDTHTAVGKKVYDKYTDETGDTTKTVLVSTASPFKFNASVIRALLGDEVVAGRSEFELLEELARIGKMEIPPGLRNLDQKPVLHKTSVAREDMAQLVRDLLARR